VLLHDDAPPPHGDVAFLCATTHPDSSLALDGQRDLTRKSKRLAAQYKEQKVRRHTVAVSALCAWLPSACCDTRCTVLAPCAAPTYCTCVLEHHTACLPAFLQFKVVGMAHCRGDSDDTWLVLTILQGIGGEVPGDSQAGRGAAAGLQQKMPALYELRKRGRVGSSSSNSSNKDGCSWLFMGATNQLPQHSDAEVLWQLLQLHVPELLQDGGGDSNSSSGGPGGLASRQLCFIWSAPRLGLHTAPEARAAAVGAGSGSSSGSGWYLDLLQPSAQRLSSSPSDGSLFSMDAYLEARRGSSQA
jgi:hypothetical protein